MSKTIDQRVVEMQFDNKNFEKNVSQSMSTLDKLKNSLNFSGATKAIDELNSSTSKLNFSPMTSALDTVTSKFSALETIAIGALLNIGNQVADTATKLIKSLSVDNISEGWSKFGEKTTAVATLSAQGYTTEEITKQIEKLNWFTDETSYNLTDMTKEIGKFTSAGQNLEDSVTAMEGIATIAALAGQNASTASRVMYQISQAMGKGVMRADDWKSVENANMVSEELKQNIIDTAIALGTVKDNADGTYTSIADGYKSITFTVGSFTSSLTEGGWFNSDVMMTVFKDYGKAATALQAYVNKSVDDEIETASDAIADLKEKASEYQKEMELVGESITMDDALKHISLIEMKQIPEVVDEATAHMEEYNKQIRENVEAYMLEHPQIKTVEEAIKELGLIEMESVDDALIDLGYQLDSLSLKAFEAGQEARTFEDVINSVKDAVSTGWMTTFENIFGNYDEAKVLWTDLANELYGVFAEGGNARNEMMGAWKELGGRDLLFANTEEETGALWNLFYALTDIVNVVKEAFKEIFPPMTAERLYEITERFKEFTERIRLNEDQLNNLIKIFVGLFSALDLIGRIVIAVAKGFSPLVPIFKKLGEFVYNLISGFADWAIETDESFKELDKFEQITLAVSTAVQKVIDVVGKAIEFFKNLATTIRDLFSQNGEDVSFGDRMSSIFSKISDVIKGLIDKLGVAGSLFKDLFERVKPIFKAIYDAILDTMDKIVGVFNGTITNIDAEKLFDGITKIFTTGLGAAILIGIKNIVSSIKDNMTDLSGVLGFKDLAKPITEAFGSLKDVLVSYQNNLKADTLLKIAAAIGILTLSLIVLASMDQDQLNNAISAITILFTDLVGAFALLNQSMKTSKTTGIVALGASMIEMAIALLILSVFMKQIADMEWESIAKSLAAMAVAIYVMPSALNNIKDTKGLVRKGLSLILVATSLVILGSAMTKIAEISWDGVGKALASMTISLYLMTSSLNGINETKGLVRKALSLILVSTSLVILGSAMTKIAEIPWDGIGKALSSMIIALYSMTGALNGVKETKGLVRKALSLILVSTSLVILGTAMTKIAYISWDGIGKALASMAVALYLMTYALNGINESKGVVRKSISLILVATSLVILGAAMKKIAEIPWDGIGKALASMVVALYLMTFALNNIKETKGLVRKATSLILVATSLVILGEAMTKIANISWQGIGKALASMVVSIYVVTSMLNEIKTDGLLRKALALILVFASFNNLASAMEEIATLSWEGIGKALASIVISLYLVFAILNGLKTEGLLSKAAAILIVSVALMAIAASLKLLSTMSWEGLAIGLLGLVGVFTILGVAASILGPMAGQILALSVSIATAAISFMLFSGAALLLGIALITIGAGLASIGASMIPVAAGLKELIPVLAEELPILLVGIATAIKESAPAFADAIIAVVQGVLKIIEEVAPDVIATLLRTIFKILDALVDNIPDILSKIIQLVGAVLSAIVEILPEWGPKLFDIIVMLLGLLVEYMPQIVDKLVDLVVSLLVSLASRVPDLLDAVVVFISALFEGVIKAIGTLVGEFIGSIISGVGQVIADGLPHIGEKLSEFSDAIQPFIDMTGGISEDSMKGVKLLAETILLITAAELLNSLSDFLSFFGGSTSTTFGESIVSFGESMVKFADITKDIDSTQVAGSAMAAKALAEFANNLPKEGGLWQDFFGTGNLTKFGEELASFAPHFVSYANEVAKIEDTDAVVASANAAKSLADFANNLPKHDGVWQEWVGDSSLTTFAKELDDFAPSLVSYAGTVRGINTADVQNSIDAAKILADFATNLPDHGGVVQWFMGDSTLSSFAAELDAFAPSLVSYAETVKGLDSSVIEKSAAAAGALSALESGLSDSGGVVAFFAGDNTLKGFGQSLEAFGQSFSIYYNSVVGINPDNIKGVTEATKDFVDICLTMQQVDVEVPERFGEVLERLGYALIDGFSTAFTGGKAQLDSAINEAIQTVYDKFEADRLSFLRYGEYFMEDLITGVINKNSRVITVAKNVSNNLKNQFNNKQIEFKTLGEYLIQGFIDGFEGKTDDVKNKATAIANAAIVAMKETLNEHSPSKVMYSIGEFAGQGFVNALHSYVDVSANAGEDIATAATDSLRDALAQSAASFDTSVDVQPTIRPVLDLSNINEGIGELDGMFDANRSIALAGSANLAMEDAAGDIQNEIKVDNSDVVTAITDLQTDMADMVDKITNMQIYLDKNVLVGQMAGPMDKALGTNYRRNLRE